MSNIVTDPHQVIYQEVKQNNIMKIYATTTPPPQLENQMITSVTRSLASASPAISQGASPASTLVSSEVDNNINSMDDFYRKLDVILENTIIVSNYKNNYKDLTPQQKEGIKSKVVTELLQKYIISDVDIENKIKKMIGDAIHVIFNTSTDNMDLISKIKKYIVDKKTQSEKTTTKPQEHPRYFKTTGNTGPTTKSVNNPRAILHVAPTGIQGPTNRVNAGVYGGKKRTKKTRKTRKTRKTIKTKKSKKNETRRR